MYTFASEALSSFSHFQLVFLRDPPDLTSLSFPKIDTNPVNYSEYYNLLLARAQMIGRLLLEWRTQQALEYKKKNKWYTNEEIFQDDQIVYLLAPHSSALQTDTTKFKQDFIGPFFIDTALDKIHCRLKDTTGLLFIGNLNSGYLTHCILDSQVLTKYLEIIEDDLEDTAPEYEQVFTSVYQYYGNSLASFTNTIDDLLLQLLILIKLKVQVPMSLFSIETVPVSLDAETHIGDKREYTQIIPETEYIALTDNNYVPLTQAQISLCAKIGYTYYCEYAHLLKKHTEHTCMSAIYYDQESEIKANQCKTMVTFDNTQECKILDTDNILILFNLHKPGTIVCKDVLRVFEIEYSTYRISYIFYILELCECSLTAGNYLLSQTDTNCRDMPEARDSYFTTYYAFNKIILDIITVKFNIQVDDRTITESTLLHDDIPGYNLLTREFVLPTVTDNEDLILKEENLEIYVHLENVLVHMINAQDVAIFKSQKDYTRNKQKLLEYIHYAQIWQALLVIFSYAAFTCDIILVITLIVFFIRY